MDCEVGISKCKLLSVEWIHRVLLLEDTALYSTACDKL